MASGHAFASTRGFVVLCAALLIPIVLAERFWAPPAPSGRDAEVCNDACICWSGLERWIKSRSRDPEVDDYVKFFGLSRKPPGKTSSIPWVDEMRTDAGDWTVETKGYIRGCGAHGAIAVLEFHRKVIGSEDIQGHVLDSQPMTRILAAHKEGGAPYEPWLTMNQALLNGFSIGFAGSRTVPAKLGVYVHMLTDYEPSINLHDLLGWVRRKKQFDNQLARFILGQLIWTLRKLDEGHVAHRDIKPDNVVLKADCVLHWVMAKSPQSWMEDGCAFTLIDFGSACATVVDTSKNAEMGAEMGCSDESQRGRKGTPPYIAPEVWDAERPMGTPAADVFGMGIVAWRIFCNRQWPLSWDLAGLRGWELRNTARRFYRDRVQKAVFGPLAKSGLDEHTQGVILGMLAVDKRERLTPENLWERLWTDVEEDTQEQMVMTNIKDQVLELAEQLRRPREGRTYIE